MKIICFTCKKEIHGPLFTNDEIRDKRYERHANFHKDCLMLWRNEAPHRRQEWEAGLTRNLDVNAWNGA